MRRCKGQYFDHGYHEFELGFFHQWECNYEDNADGYIGNFSTAIVELPDGKVVMPIATDIEFID